MQKKTIKEISPDEIIEAYKNLSQKLEKENGATLKETINAYKSGVFPFSFSQIRKVFDGINDLKRSSGFKVTDRIHSENTVEELRNISPDKLIEAYKELSQKLNSENGATQKEIDIAYKSANFPYRAHQLIVAFGGINKIRELAGFKTVREKTKYTIDDVLKKAEELYLRDKKLIARSFIKEMELIKEKFGSWLNFLKQNNFYDSEISIADKIRVIEKSSKYIIDKNENRIYYKKNNKELLPNTSENKCRYAFRVNKKDIVINKYVFWSFIHELIDTSFDTKYRKISFKNGKEEYTEKNIIITVKGDKSGK